MTRYVSFSLFGDSPKYFSGAIQNAESIPEILPGWRAVYYCGPSVSPEIREELESRGAKIISMKEAGDGHGTIWRFRVFEDFQDAEMFIARDADSLISNCEALEVEAWASAASDIMVIRGSWNHIWHMPAGLVGFRRTHGLKESLLKVTSYSASDFYYGLDADLLYWHVWRNKRHSRTVITPLSSIYLPECRDGEFFGRVAFDESGLFIPPEISTAPTPPRQLLLQIQNRVRRTLEAIRVERDFRSPRRRDH